MVILYSDSSVLGKTPARVNRMTGEIFINKDIWDNYPEPYQKFILAHEEGHYMGQQTNELFADHYALMKIAGTFPESLKTAIRTITDILPGTSENQQVRILNIFRVALLWDLLHKPRKTTRDNLLKVEEQLAAYRHLPDLKEYEMILSQMRKGRPNDYEFPGYEPRMFQPAVGSWFVDVPLSESQTQQAFDERYAPTTYEDDAPVSTIDLRYFDFEDHSRHFDLKTIAIVILVVVCLFLIYKANK